MKRIEPIHTDAGAIWKFCNDVANGATPRRAFALLHNLTAEQVEQNPAALPCDVLDEIRAEIETYINAATIDTAQTDGGRANCYAVALSFLNKYGTFEQVARAIAPESGTPDTSTPRPVYQVHAETRTDEPAPESGTDATNTGGACTPYTLQTNKTPDELNAIFDRLTAAGFVVGDTGGHDERRRDFLNAFAVTNDGGAGRIVWTGHATRAGKIIPTAQMLDFCALIGGGMSAIDRRGFNAAFCAVFNDERTPERLNKCKSDFRKHYKHPTGTDAGAGSEIHNDLNTIINP